MTKDAKLKIRKAVQKKCRKIIDNISKEHAYQLDMENKKLVAVENRLTDNLVTTAALSSTKKECDRARKEWDTNQGKKDNELKRLQALVKK